MGLFDFLKKNKMPTTAQNTTAQDNTLSRKELEKQTNSQTAVKQQIIGKTRSTDTSPHKNRANPSTSKDEQYIYYYVKRFFPRAINRYVFQNDSGNRFEADVFIPEINVVIEYDGLYWHKDKLNRDIEKTKYFNEIGLYVIHVRETGLEPLPDFIGLELWHRVGRSKQGMHTNEYISCIIQDLSCFCDGGFSLELSVFSLSYEQFCFDLPDINSLIYTHSVSNPVSSFEEFRYWDYELNGRLNPDNVPSKANIKVFLKCPSGQIKHVNVSSVCGAGFQKEYPVDDYSGMCPLFGQIEICTERCEYSILQVIKYLDRYIEGKEKLKDLRWMHWYALNNDTILSYAFRKYIAGDMSKSQFGELFLERNNLISMNWFVDISTAQTLMLLFKAQRKYNSFEARLDASRFDTDDESQNALIKYLDNYFEYLEPYWRGVYLNEVFCGAFQRKIVLSKSLKRKMSKLVKKRPVEGLSADMQKWILL